MNMLLLLITILSVLILLQDFHSRSVLWIFFPLLAMAGILLGHGEVGLGRVLLNGAVNFTILLVQLSLLFFFFFYRSGWKVKKLTEKIGAGDVLFLLSCCFFFSPLNFIAFYITSLLLSLALHFIFLRNRRYSRNGSTVALAGWQAFSLLLVLLVVPATGLLYSDDWLLNSLLWTH